MTRFKLLILCGLLACFLPAQAQLFRAHKVGRTRTTLDELLGRPVSSSAFSRRVAAATRARYARKRVLMDVSRSIVQVGTLSSNLGSGFLFEKDGQLWVATAAHIGGPAGKRRVIHVFNENGQPLAFPIEIATSGKAGWHAADVSIARVPQEALSGGAKPLALGDVEQDAPAYSLGYISGDIQQDEFFIFKRHINTKEGYSLQGIREPLPLEDPHQPFLLSGYCGAPVVQRLQGRWKVVGVDVGACVMPDNPSANKSFMVNVSQTFPFLLDQAGQAQLASGRTLFFRGWQVDRLTWEERVEKIQVLREGNVVFKQEIRNYPQPYSVEHSEYALEDFETCPGDVVRYVILGSGRQSRQVEFVIP